MARPKKGEEHPREDLADKIKLMVAIGIPQEQIAGILKMSKETLSVTYRDSIDYGAKQPTRLSVARYSRLPSVASNGPARYGQRAAWGGRKAKT